MDYRRTDFCFLLHTFPVCSSFYHEAEQGSLLFEEWGGRGNNSKENYKVDLGKKKNPPLNENWLLHNIFWRPSPPTLAGSSAPEVGFIVPLCTCEKQDLGRCYKVPAATHLVHSRAETLFFVHLLASWGRRRDHRWAYGVQGEIVLAGHLQEVSP